MTKRKRKDRGDRLPLALRAVLAMMAPARKRKRKPRDGDGGGWGPDGG